MPEDLSAAPLMARSAGTDANPAGPVPEPRHADHPALDQMFRPADLPGLLGHPGRSPRRRRSRPSRAAWFQGVGWIGALGLTAAAGLGVRTVAFHDTPAPSADEAELVTHVVELTRSGTSAAGELASRVGALAVPELAAFTRITSWSSAPSALGAVRESSLAAWLLVALLCWLLARRLGMGRPWALASVALLALCPTAIGVSRMVVPENLAICWGLAALVLAAGRPRVGRAQFWVDLAIAGLLALAVLTAPVALALLPAALLVVARNGDLRRAILLGVLSLLTSAAAFAVAVFADAASRGAPTGDLDPGGPESWLAVGWLGLDAVTPLVAVLAALLALRSDRLRALGVGLLAVPVLAAPLDLPANGLYPLIVPLASMAVAGVAQEWLGSGGRRPAAPTAAAVLMGGFTLAWAVNLVQLPAATAPPPTEWARDWLRTNVASSERVLTDDRSRVVLTRGTDEWDRVSTPLACARHARLSPVPTPPTGCTDPEWWVLPGSTRPATPAGPGTAPTGPPPSATLVAVFGADGEPEQVDVLATRWPLTDPAREQLGRQAAGELLTSSPRLRVDPALAQLLRAGRLDSRAATALGALLTEHPVRLVELPEIRGEGAIGRPLRQLLLAPDTTRPQRPGASPEQLVVDFFTAQMAPFRPYSMAISPSGVLVRYPPQGPPGLLDNFLTR